MSAQNPFVGWELRSLLSIRVRKAGIARMKLGWRLSVVLSLAVGVALGAQSTASITIDATKTFQTMDGFGSSERVFDDPHLTETFDPQTQRSAVILTRQQQDQLLNALYVDLGFTRVRPTTDAGIEEVNDNSDPNDTDLSKFNFAWKRNDAHVDYVQRAAQRGVTTFFLSPVRVESWMGRTSATDVAEYVEWAMAQLRRWRQLGTDVPFYSVHNEPALSHISGEFIRDVIKVMGPKLDAESMPTRFVITDDWGPQEAYERSVVILADPVARRYVGALASHIYTSGDMTSLSALAKQYHLPLWMTEFYRGEWRDPFQYAALMSDLITRYDVSAVDYMWGFFGAWENYSQLVRVLYNDRRFADFDPAAGPAYRGYEFDKAYYTVGQFSRFVRPGSVRVEARSDDPSLKVAAFRSSENLAIVIVNDSDHDKRARFTLSGVITSTRTRTIRTTATENWGESAEPILLSTSVIPMKSVSTVILPEAVPGQRIR